MAEPRRLWEEPIWTHTVDLLLLTVRVRIGSSHKPPQRGGSRARPVFVCGVAVQATGVTFAGAA
jgi:hypothetical protein